MEKNLSAVSSDGRKYAVDIYHIYDRSSVTLALTSPTGYERLELEFPHMDAIRLATMILASAGYCLPEKK